MKNKEMLAIMNKLFAAIEKLIPVYMEDPLEPINQDCGYPIKWRGQKQARFGLQA